MNARTLRTDGFHYRNRGLEPVFNLVSDYLVSRRLRVLHWPPKEEANGLQNAEEGYQTDAEEESRVDAFAKVGYFARLRFFAVRGTATAPPA